MQPDAIQGDAIVITGHWDAYGFDGQLRLWPVATGWIFDVAESGAPPSDYYGRTDGKPFKYQWEAFQAAIESCGEEPDRFCQTYAAI